MHICIHINYRKLRATSASSLELPATPLHHHVNMLPSMNFTTIYGHRNIFVTEYILVYLKRICISQLKNTEST